MRLAEALEAAEQRTSPRSRRRLSTKTQQKPSKKIVYSQGGGSLLDHPMLLAKESFYEWSPSEDRGPGIRDEFKAKTMRPLPENINEQLDVVADRFRPWE
jgi:hypothetical protein